LQKILARATDLGVSDLAGQHSEYSSEKENLL
jgi:hypothetical protein